jgi:hypothetical protein
LNSLLSEASTIPSIDEARLVLVCKKLLVDLDRSPKSLRWKARACVGDLLSLYTPIDER